MPVLRRAEAGDLGEIAGIQAGSTGAAQWPAEEYLAYDTCVALCDDRVVGFICGRQLAPGECEILNLAVAPAYRRRGVAGALVEWLTTSHSGSVFLEVRESNWGARRFYESVGFKELSRRSEYYDNPLEAAIVMKFHSC